MSYEQEEYLDSLSMTKLNRQEKITLISSVMSGAIRDAYFDEKAVENRIKQCLAIAEKLI